MSRVQQSSAYSASRLPPITKDRYCCKCAHTTKDLSPLQQADFVVPQAFWRQMEADHNDGVAFRFKLRGKHKTYERQHEGQDDLSSARDQASPESNATMAGSAGGITLSIEEVHDERVYGNSLAAQMSGWQNQSQRADEMT
ncbi:hypothetical protein LTR27_002728 [Elasticomyces elasticus]|nr:hypothetical protein LTR27_002728 [Elasticomyces elasticus]